MFINSNGQTYAATTSRKITGKISVTIPKNKDTGQSVLVAAVQDGNPRQIVLTTQLGYTISIPSGVILSMGMNQDAGDTVKSTFDFRDSGGFTVT